jgi:anti-anti-sigma factor
VTLGFAGMISHPSQRSDDADQGLQMSVAMEGEQVVISLIGEIDIANAALLPHRVSTIVDGVKPVRLDLTQVTFLDASALRGILMCEAGLGRKGVDLKLRNVPDHAKRIFEVTHLTHLIE